ncbi:Cyclic nucleotide-binding domain-containing protein [Gammaproteobacteria bacterium]
MPPFGSLAEDHDAADRFRVDALLLRLLSQVRLFAGFQRSDLLEILNVIEKVVFARGEYIFYEGDLGESLYILISGEVQVIKGKTTHHPIEITRFSPGESFGEMALVEKKPRSASIRTLDRCTVLRLNGKDLVHLPNAAAKLHFNIAKLLATRLRDSNEIILGLKEHHHIT